jgi:hypothetical protein
MPDCKDRRLLCNEIVKDIYEDASKDDIKL